MSMYNLIAFSDNYSKTTRSLWKYYREQPSLNDDDVINNFLGNSASFKFKQKITDKTGADGTKNIEIMVPLKYLSSFWRAPEMPLINCDVNLILTWFEYCVMSDAAAATQATTFAMTDTNFYVPVVTLST